VGELGVVALQRKAEEGGYSVCKEFCLSTETQADVHNDTKQTHSPRAPLPPLHHTTHYTHPPPHLHLNFAFFTST